MLICIILLNGLMEEKPSIWSPTEHHSSPNQEHFCWMENVRKQHEGLLHHLWAPDQLKQSLYHVCHAVSFNKVAAFPVAIIHVVVGGRSHHTPVVSVAVALPWVSGRIFG